MKHSRLYWILFTLGLCLLSVTVTTAVCYRHRTVPRDHCSALFRSYAGTDGIQAAFIRDMHIDPDVTVDATLLTATDSAGWQRLVADLDLQGVLPELPPAGGKPTTVFLHHPKTPETLEMYPDAPATDLLAVSAGLQSVCLFHLTSNSQVEAIMLYKIREIKKQTLNNTTL